MKKRLICMVLTVAVLLAVPIGTRAQPEPTLMIFSARLQEDNLSVTYALQQSVPSQEITCLVYTINPKGEAGDLLQAVQTTAPSNGVHTLQIPFMDLPDRVIVQMGGTAISTWREVTVAPDFVSKGWILVPNQTVGELQQQLSFVQQLTVEEKTETVTDATVLLPGDRLHGIYEGQEFVLYAYLPGDVDLDGKVGAKDALDVLRYVVGKIELTQAAQLAADIRQSGKINANSALMILQYIVGKINTL